MIFKSGRDLVVTVEAFNTATQQNIIYNANDVTTAMAPVEQYTNMMIDRMTDAVISRFDLSKSRLRRMAFCCLVVLLIKIQLFMSAHTWASWTDLRDIWTAGGWTGVFLVIFYFGWSVWNKVRVSAEYATVMREASLGIMLCYDRLFTQRELWSKLHSLTPQADESAMIYDKGYAERYLNELVLVFRNCPFIGGITKDAVLKEVKVFTDRVKVQHNCLENFESNYRMVFAGSQVKNP